MQKKGVETNLQHLLKKISISFFFALFKELRQSWAEILIIVSIFKRLWTVLRATRTSFFVTQPPLRIQSECGKISSKYGHVLGSACDMIQIHSFSVLV